MNEEKKKDSKVTGNVPPRMEEEGVSRTSVMRKLSEPEKKKQGFSFFRRKKWKNEETSTEFNVSVERFYPKVEEGLKTEQVELRKEQGLVNITPKKYTKSIGRIIYENLFTYFNVLMSVILILMLVFNIWLPHHLGLKDFAFVVVVGCNLIFGTYQQIKAKLTTDKMRLLIASEATVIRNGRKEKINPEEIVLDDIVFLKSGEQLSCDGVVKKGQLEMNESQQTGESLPVKKQEGGEVYSGSFVVSGNAYIQVTSVGENTMMGKLARRAKSMKTRTSELYRSIMHFISFVSYIVVPLGVLSIITNYLITEDGFGQPFNITEFSQSMISTCSMMIGMIPSGLVLLTSIALTLGVLRLAERNTLVQDIYSIERLARVNCLCFDKTGTLTDGTLKFEDKINLAPENDTDELIGHFLFALKEDANSTSRALEKIFPYREGWEVSKILPFNSERKYSAVSFKNHGVLVLGAPEMLLSAEEKNREIHAKIASYQETGLRVLVFGKAEGLNEKGIEGNITSLCLLILSDHIRSSAKTTIRWFADNDVEVKVISGDSALTVSKIAEKAGVPGADKYISLAGLNLEETAEAADEYTVFGRVSPEQKAVLIRSLKEKGKNVAMTGDGINDILAMKEADCAIGMANGAEASRSAAHVILMNSDFSSMPDIVKEGRRVVNNIRNSASLFIMKTFYVIMIALTSVISTMTAYSFRYPMLTGTMLILETMPIGIDAFLLGLQPNSERIHGSFFKQVIARALPASAAMYIATMIIISLIQRQILPFDYSSEFRTETLQTSLIALVLDFTGMAMVFFLCLPFNFYRTLVFVLSAVTVASVIVLDREGRISSIVFRVMNESTWLLELYLVLGIFVIMLVAYLVIRHLEKKKRSESSKLS